jgi:GNAT superfamily N-acetyltransferase
MTSILAERDGYCIDSDPARLQPEVIFTYISQRSYWGQGRSAETMRTAMANSLNFGVYAGQRQVGYARVITDQILFAYICDVFILESERGRGLGKWLVATLTAWLDARGIHKTLLATRDAHGLYQRYGGFTPLDPSGNTLQRVFHAPEGETDQAA